MKKIQLIIFAVFVSAPSIAQESVGVVSTQSFHINASAANVHFGLGYSYELAAADRITILGSVWLKHEIVLDPTIFNERSIWLTFPGISLEPRWYYNLGRRNSKDRSLRMNSGSFLALTASCFLPSIYGTGGYRTDYVFYGINPKWGMRRVFRNNMFLEFQTGIVILTDFNAAVAGYDVNLKIGYTF